MGLRMQNSSAKSSVSITINGSRHELFVDPSRPLLTVIREDLDLTGSKQACDDGECGSCIVLLGKKGLMSCLLPVSRAQNKEITTIEGLAAQQAALATDGYKIELGELHPLQRAFLELSASQWGFCIPGMIMQASALLNNKPNPTREDVVNHLARNLCRCMGYNKIIDAVLYAADLMGEGEKGTW